MNRNVVIYHSHEKCYDNVFDMIKMLSTKFDNIFVATSTPNEKFNSKDGTCTVLNINWPSDATNQPKQKNWIRQYFKTQQFKGFLHIVEDIVKMNDISKFVDDIENAMNVFDYSSWLSTCSDPCNYVYSRFNPRLAIELDRPEYAKLNLPNKIYFTSHSNTAWEIFDYSKISDELLKFDERFDVAMYFIIAYLANRRNTKPIGSLYYMNQYFTVESEHNAYKCINVEKEDISEKMKVEDPLFKEMKIDYHPDNNVDMILEDVYNKLTSKLQ